MFALHCASVSCPTSGRLVVHYWGSGSVLEAVGDSAHLLEWKAGIAFYINEWKARRRLATLYMNRMRFTGPCSKTPQIVRFFYI